MFYLIHFLPLLLFIVLYVGTGIYYTALGVENAFYQLSPIVAIIPAIALAWVLYKGKTEERMNVFLNGVRHPDIITMCIIFLLAGAFSEVTRAIGSVDATVNLALSLIPSHLMLIGLFLTSAFISTAIGSSLGTIATIAPIAAALTAQGAFPAALGAATVVGGAMFGDNLSIISDTTIAAVMSQEADMWAKLKLNAKIAFITSAITLPLLFFSSTMNGIHIQTNTYSLLLITPYLLLIGLAGAGVNVFITLVTSIAFAGIIGFITSGYGLLFLSQHIATGMASMHEIMVLSLLVGGLSGLAAKGSKELTSTLTNWISKHGSQKMAQLVIAQTVSLFDILFANNTVAIIFSGEIARDIAKKYKIPAHYSAAWLDIFSCVFQGIIPYGAQLLLASTIAGVSPLAVMPHVYYCYVLGAVSCVYIMTIKPVPIS